MSDGRFKMESKVSRSRHRPVRGPDVKASDEVDHR